MEPKKSKKFPKIGVNVIIFNEDNILLGLRKRTGNEGMWCPPGGHLHWNEGIIECAEREVFEETGLLLTNFRIGPYTNDRNSNDGRHYLSLFVIAEFKSGKLINGEPYDIKKWEWFQIENLPSPLFYNIGNLLKENTLANLKNFKMDNFNNYL